MAAFDFSPSFAGINSALTDLGKHLQERRDTDALLKAFDQTQGGGGSTTPLRLTGATSVPTPAAAALGNANEIETRFIDTIKGAGLTNPIGLGAVAATGKAESGYAPQNVNRSWSDPSESGQPGMAGGIMSWRAGRLANLQNFARSRGEAQPSVETQALFLAHENPQLIPALQAAKSPQEANQIMANAWRYAGFNRAGGENARRLALTQSYAQRYGGQGGPAPAIPVQVAENEADVQRLEAQQGNPVVDAPIAAPVQVAQADALALGATEAQGFAIPGAQPATRENINAGMIRALIAKPSTRQMGMALWQQAMTGKQFGFQVVGDQLYRTDPRTGTVEAVPGITNPKAQLDMENTRADIALKNRQLGEKKLSTFTSPDGTTYSFDPATGETQPVASGQKPKALQSVRGEDGTLYSFDPETGITTPQVKGGPKSEDVTGLRKEVQNLPSYKNMAQAVPIYKSMLETAGRDSKASDLNLVYGLGKIMDPTSVVREGEMVMVRNSAGLSENLIGAINSLNGGAALTPQTRQALMQEAYSRMQSYRQVFDQDVAQYDGIVQRRGMNRDDVIPSFPGAEPYTPATKPAKAEKATAPAVKPGSVPVPPQAVRALRADPGRAAEFDAKYGAGMSKRILGN